jgi:hypothetical protein
MVSPQEVVSIGRGPSTECLPRDIGIADGREGGIVHGAPPPPGWSLPINVIPIPVPDDPPMEQEIWEVVEKLRNGCAAGVTGMKAENLTLWHQV